MYKLKKGSERHTNLPFHKEDKWNCIINDLNSFVCLHGEWSPYNKTLVTLKSIHRNIWYGYQCIYSFW